MPVEIIKISQEPRPGPTGVLEPYVRIDFKVGTQGPFTEYFPKATYNPTTAKAAMSAFALMIEQTHR